MKSILKTDLIKILKFEKDLITEDDLYYLMQIYGDDYNTNTKNIDRINTYREYYTKHLE